MEKEVAVRILRKAYKGGITFFDTSRAYSDSEEKLGLAFAGMREKIFIATKTRALTPEAFWKDIDSSLAALQTDYIDIYQFHWPDTVFRPGDGTGMYECLLEAQEQGKIRHIGFTNHKIGLAQECVESGLYDTLQYPFSYLSTEKEIGLVRRTHETGMGFLAMKALSGGLIRNSAAAYAFIAGYENVLPLWGIQRESELDEFLAYRTNPPVLDEELLSKIEMDKKELSGNFCRGCGYCMPCPVEIEINMCARMMNLIRRAPSKDWLTPKSREMMKKIGDCTECGKCKTRCPYGLEVPDLLAKNYEDYQKILAGEIQPE